MNKKFAVVFSELLGSISVIQFYELFSEHFSRILSIVFASICAVILMLIAEQIILLFPKHIRKLRKYGKYEGEWIEVLRDRPEAPYSCCDIKYHSGSDNYTFEGANYVYGTDNPATSDPKDIRQFVCEHLYPGDFGFSYIDRDHANGIQCYGIYTFSHDKSGGVKATGWFIDAYDANQINICKVIMYKCDRKLLKELGLKKHHTQIELIKAFEKKYGRSIH